MVVERVAERVRELAASYEPPSFEHVPSSDAALFLTAIDHRAGYREPHLVDGVEQRGSALMWDLGARHRLDATAVRDINAEEVGAMFEIEGDTVEGPEVRAGLWRDLAAALLAHYEGRAQSLLEASDGRLAGKGGLLERLGVFRAYADPLQKKSFLFAKIAERRGWCEVADPEHWRVCADSVLMRLALRSGLVEPGEPEDVRRRTIDAFERVSTLSGVPANVLDDLLWERGREDPDLLGNEGGDLREPPRPPGTIWY